MPTMVRTPLILGVFALLAAAIPESRAEAGTLKNSKRVGDRSSMTIIRRPSSSQRKRIYAPGERPAGTSRPRTSRKQQHAWFWKIHAPALAAGSGDRWQAALETMSKRRTDGKAMTKLDHLRQITLAYGPQLSAAARRHDVSEYLLTAVISIESRGRSAAVSPKGATGLMQLMPATAKRFGVTDATNPAQNIGGGASYLNWLLTEFNGDPLHALAGYNAGEGAVRKHKGVPPFAETRDYVVKVFDALAALTAICPDLANGPRARCPIASVPDT